MKKILLCFVMILVSISASAQVQFYQYKPAPPATYVPTIPSIPYPDYPDYSYRRVPRRISSSISNKFSGITLGYDRPQEAIRKLNGVGFKCESESSGYFTRVVTTEGCQFEGANFKDISLYFFKDRLWSITFEYCQSDPQLLGNRLESKYSDHSISDTNYEYMDGDVILTFDGNMLSFQSNSVLTLIAKSANGQ
jgi:hypothetical protein